MSQKIPEINNSNHDYSIDFKYRSWIMALRKCAIKHRHRAVIAISGSQNYCYSLARDLISAAEIVKAIWLSDSFSNSLKPKLASTQLGQEYEAIVFDMHSGFDPDAFGAICGTLVGGGILFMLIPDQKNWNEIDSSRFLRRILPIIRDDASVMWLEDTKSLPEINCMPVADSQLQSVPEPFRTVEQSNVVDAIESMTLANMHRPVVLMSDRGRGKSAALGLAAGRLLQQGMKRIAVTAPRMSISEPVFRHARQICVSAELHHGQLRYKENKLIFIAPDALLDKVQQVDLLLVDEAASIPLPMLEGLLINYPSIVFATTVHGYEGTGRGFALKFDKVLDRLRPGWQLFNMNTPVRWAEDDPVEPWIDYILCLDAELADVAAIPVVEKKHCRIVLQDRDELVSDNNKLSSIFALLINAHYRTRPSDLLFMMDVPGVRVYTLEYHDYIVAAVLINEEGGFNTELSSRIYQGERRPGGHLLAQTLTFHAGCEAAATLKYSRIMRIAVHPELQRQGLGSLLLEQVVLSEKKQQIDAIGTSFGASIDLLKFWECSGFSMVRLGFTRDHASGTYSAVMLMPLTIVGSKVFHEVRSRFQRYLPAWIDEVYKNIPDDMLLYLNNTKQDDDLELTEADWKDVSSFAHSHRGYESCMWPLKKLVNYYPDVFSALSQFERVVIDARIVEKKNWLATVKITGALGKADAIRQLRHAIKSMLIKLRK